MISRGAEERVLYAQTFSKNWAMTGWRVGWLEAPEALGGTIENLIQYSTSGVATFVQRAAVTALDEGEPFLERQIAVARTRARHRARKRAGARTASRWRLARRGVLRLLPRRGHHRCAPGRARLSSTRRMSGSPPARPSVRRGRLFPPLLRAQERGRRRGDASHRGLARDALWLSRPHPVHGKSRARLIASMRLVILGLQIAAPFEDFERVPS